MRWTRGHSSSYVDDRRAEGPARAGLGGGGIGLLMWLFSRFGLAGLLIGGALLYFGGGLFSGDSSSLAGSDSNVPMQTADGRDPEAEMVQFVSFVLDDNQETWAQTFARAGKRYEPARMVLFRGSTPSGCGLGQAAMGPFYCPRDQKVYIDLSFYRELKQRFGAPGDFAQAYVIAHEIGHHVQHQLGLDRNVSGAQRVGAGSGAVRLELQADCLAGVWSNATKQRSLLEPGDIDEAMGAAAAIGDDRLQRESTGTVSPESWTHGSSEERQRWFRRGYESGSLEACDTFGASSL
ncbi:MAG: neutral zinc metallopeptidase [Myxococcales bacterium]